MKIFKPLEAASQNRQKTQNSCFCFEGMFSFSENEKASLSFENNELAFI